MPKTIDLLQRALEIKTVSDWARTFNIVPSTITNARRQGRLSPALAGNLAMELGEDVTTWMLAANLENEREALLMDRLRNAVPEWRKRWLPPVSYVARMLQQRAGMRFVFSINRALDHRWVAVKNQCKRVQRIHAGRPQS